MDALDWLADLFGGGPAAAAPPPQFETDFPEDLPAEVPVGPPAAAPAPMASASPASPPPPPSKGRPVKEIVSGGVQYTPQGKGPVSFDAPVSDFNPSEPIEDLRKRLGFSWGKGVELNPETGRPTTDTMHSASGTGAPVMAHESTGGGGYVMQPDIEKIPVGQRPESYFEGLDKGAAAEKAKRETERSQVTGKPAAETSGEMLEDRRRHQYQQDLAVEKNAKMAEYESAIKSRLEEAQAKLAGGEWTPDQYATERQQLEAARELYRQQLERAYAMQAGVDPRFFSQPTF